MSGGACQHFFRDCIALKGLHLAVCTVASPAAARQCSTAAESTQAHGAPAPLRIRTLLEGRVHRLDGLQLLLQRRDLRSPPGSRRGAGFVSGGVSTRTDDRRWSLNAPSAQDMSLHKAQASPCGQDRHRSHSSQITQITDRTCVVSLTTEPCSSCRDAAASSSCRRRVAASARASATRDCSS